jgi:hypothetical protein
MKSVPPAKGFTRFFDFMANLGLFIRDDPPKVIDMTGREFGPAVNGLELSIRELPKEEPGVHAVLSVVIRNRETEKKTFSIPGWLFFYEIQIDAPMSGYGNQVLKPERKTERFEVTLAPHEARETDVPLGLLYDLRAGGDYRMRVSARVADGAVVTSNEIVVGEGSGAPSRD